MSGVYEYRLAPGVKVVDGDTLDADVDLGMHVHIHTRLRLLGLNAPEKDTREGVAAARFLTAALAGRTVRVVTERDRTEKYGRWLATVYAAPPDAPAQEINVNDALIRAGHAVAWDGKGARP